MRSKTISMIVVVVITALAWLNYYEHEKHIAAKKQIVNLNDRIRRLEALLEEARLPRVEDVRDAGQQERLQQGRKFQAAVEAFERRMEELQPPPAKTPPPAAPPVMEGPPPEIAAAIETMKKGGVLRTRRRAADRLLDASLNDLLNLPPDRQSLFDALRLEKQAAVNEHLVQLVGADLTETRRAELVEQAGAVMAQINERMAALLGEELYPIYEDFESTRMARIQDQLAEKALEDAGVPMDEDQAADLLDIMVREIEAYPSLASSRSSTGFAKMLASPNILLERVGEMESYHAAVMDAAEFALTQDQASVLKANLDLQRKMQQTGLALLTQSLPGAE